MGAAEQGVILVFDHGAYKGRHLRSGQQQRDGMHLEHVFAWVFEQKLTRKLFAGGDIAGEFLRALVKPDAILVCYTAKGIMLGIDPDFIKDARALYLRMARVISGTPASSRRFFCFRRWLPIRAGIMAIFMGRIPFIAGHYTMFVLIESCHHYGPRNSPRP